MDRRESTATGTYWRNLAVRCGLTSATVWKDTKWSLVTLTYIFIFLFEVSYVYPTPLRDRSEFCIKSGLHIFWSNIGTALLLAHCFYVSQKQCSLISSCLWKLWTSTFYLCNDNRMMMMMMQFSHPLILLPSTINHDVIHLAASSYR